MIEFENMDRRSLMQRIALLLGAASVPTLSGCKAAMDGPGALDDRQLKLLTAIADTIIPETDTPGAVAAGVPKIISGMLRDWASSDRRKEMVAAITEIGKLGGEKGFAALDPAARKKVLLAYDAAAVKPDPNPKKKASGLAAMMGGAAAMNPGYLKIKELVIALFYSSEIASSKELTYEHNPGKFVASTKVTPETRPYAGVGGLF